MAEQMKIKIAAIDNVSQSYDLICEVKTLQNITKYEHTATQGSLNINDFAYMQEDTTFTPQTLEFKSAPYHGADDDFKNFYRSYNRQFIIEINNNGDIRYVLAKKNSESVQQIASRGRQYFTFSFQTQTYYIKYKSLSYKLTSIDESLPMYSTSVPPGEDAQDYPLQHGSTPDTLDYFKVLLPKNLGDRKMYINNQILDYDANPSFGVNDKWSETYRSFNSSITPIEGMALVVNSFPALKKIEHQDLNNTGQASINVEDLRNFEKQGYLYILPGEQVNLVMTNIREGRIQLYEQYSNVR